mmetsp:Transcript_93974/g.265813  ORF Transcript_93974/g.265813 Transcript_93974/m.265813 type:complete len:201 (-) Transcript_93974:134-736(-)
MRRHLGRYPSGHGPSPPCGPSRPQGCPPPLAAMCATRARPPAARPAGPRSGGSGAARTRREPHLRSCSPAARTCRRTAGPRTRDALAAPGRTRTPQGSTPTGTSWPCDLCQRRCRRWTCSCPARAASGRPGGRAAGLPSPASRTASNRSTWERRVHPDPQCGLCRRLRPRAAGSATTRPPPTRPRPSRRRRRRAWPACEL